ncbi:hypothetical protein D187_007313 [Cystobacter fuscus DSM 2262]|uniref:Uncharacterized protein n=1 Tax=Cystobacter fuscus (strain ATCC 25194 / DSM 2262 / NBRC 100088 / M29) TaxID=1242864 RepID=S9P3P6_CYSF2|nr:hypothetical protein [Cystobacter fuscus]EPX56877.1 hypothetical protein D187_007313 [Cystobacter fuscus DSM 2262]
MALLAVLRAASSSASEASSEESREPPAWSFWAEGDYYALPDATDYILWLASADHGLLHLEARYNYEDLRTASTFVGLNFGFGEQLRMELTPMAGVVLGRTSGLAPGLTLDLSWWKLELYSELEYVFALGAGDASFFYSWMDLSLWPIEWGRVGLVFQRTKERKTSFELERGFLVGMELGHFSAAVHVLDPGGRAYTLFMLAAQW